MTHDSMEQALAEAFAAFFAKHAHEQTPESTEGPKIAPHSAKPGFQASPAVAGHGCTSDGDI